MGDHIINLPEHYRYINQFAPSTWAPKPSLFRCVTASVAMLMEIAYPGRWIPEELEHDLYVKWAGPDVSTDQQGIDKAPVLQWFHEVGVGFVDLGNLLSDQPTLKHVIQRMNDMNIPQLFAVGDESFLRRATDNTKLHAWNDKGMGHAFVRVGYSDNEGYGLYMEPAAPGFPQPVPISWQDSIEPANLVTCVAIMPHGVAQPRQTSTGYMGPGPFRRPRSTSTVQPRQCMAWMSLYRRSGTWQMPWTPTTCIRRQMH
jgi:hypothetical protein